MARILLTGASAFTGLWIAEALARAGHHVLAPLRRPLSDYSGLRRDRVVRLAASAQVVFDAPFASPRFMDLMAPGAVDLLAHHAADIPNYRAADYDAIAGMVRNTDGAREVLAALARAGGQAVIATGTFFEPGEGGSGPDALAVSPYGLSKGLTNLALHHLAAWEGLDFAKFVIPSPFGEMEEGRLGWSLFQAWFAGQPGVIRTPRYVRDNIPVPLMAGAYADLAARVLAEPGRPHLARPSGFVGTQGDFAQRLAREARSRLDLPCQVELLAQSEFAEPEVRVNAQSCITKDWDGPGFWDGYVQYYRELAAGNRLTSPA